jgi:adenylate cyclase
LSREVSAYRGTTDKFIGDAVMAFWGAPAANAEHAVDACRAALASGALMAAVSPQERANYFRQAGDASK